MTGRGYSVIVRLHPPEFRRDFGEQMLCTYEEMAADQSSGAALYLDAIASLVRQWLLRRGLWKPILAAAISASLFSGFLATAPRIRRWSVPSNSGQQFPGEDLAKIALIALATICVLLMSIVVWAWAVHNRRSASCHWSCARSRSATAVSPLSKM